MKKVNHAENLSFIDEIENKDKEMYKVINKETDSGAYKDTSKDTACRDTSKGTASDADTNTEKGTGAKTDLEERSADEVIYSDKKVSKGKEASADNESYGDGETRSEKPGCNEAKDGEADMAGRPRFDFRTLVPTLSAVAALLVHLLVPDSPRYTFRPLPYFTITLAAVIAITIVFAVLSLYFPKIRKRYAYKSWFITAVLTFLNILNIATLKLMLLPLIYFPNPDRILKVFVDDGAFILKCLGYSLRLLATGYFTGALAGMTTGILIGWSKKWSYWVNPLIKFVGPIPSTAWVPIALVSFPTTFTASAFLIALAVWFPTTVLTSSGISNVQNSYFEVSSTLGAKTVHKIFKVALPAAAPSIFVGIFNGTGTSFVTLMTAEMMGVKYGIGWYINWQKDMLSYANVYAGLIVIAITFSLIITLLFRVRDKVLVWQKGVIKW